MLVTDGSQPLSGRVMCEHYWLSVLMYTPGMSVMTLPLKNRYESKRSRGFFRISASSGSQNLEENS
jgi:hypothetical protein